MAITRRAGILAVVEAAYGTDPGTVGADALVAVDDLAITFPHDTSTPEPIDAFLDGLAHVAGRIVTQVAFSVPLKGSGTAGTAPDIGPLLKACGFSETLVAVTSATYAPASVFGVAAAGYQSITLNIEDGTHNYEVSGCYGTWSLAADVAGYPKLAFAFTGLYERPTDDAAVTAPTYETTRPQPSRGLTMTLHGTLGGVALRPGAFTLDLAREVHIVDSMAEAFGVAAIEIGRCAPAGTFQVQAQTLAGKDWFAALEAGTLASMSVAWTGAAGNIVTLSVAGGAGGIAVQTLSRTDRNGIVTYDIAYRVQRNAGNDAVSLAFT